MTIATAHEWKRAWKNFHEATRQLHALAKRDGDKLDISVKLKVGGDRKRRAHSAEVPHK